MDTLDEFYCATFAPTTRALSDALYAAEREAGSYKGEVARLNRGIARFLSLDRAYHLNSDQFWQFRVTLDLNMIRNMVGEFSAVEREILHRFRELTNKVMRGERTDVNRLEG